MCNAACIWFIFEVSGYGVLVIIVFTMSGYFNNVTGILFYCTIIYVELVVNWSHGTSPSRRCLKIGRIKTFKVGPKFEQRFSCVMSPFISGRNTV